MRIIGIALALTLLAGGAHAQSRSTASPSARSPSAILQPLPQSLPQPGPSTGATPPSAIGTPAPQMPGIAPLSPQQPTAPSSSGGVPKQSSLALSPGSASEAAPSAPGGGGKTLGDCMGFWDAGTHMTKREWKAACERMLRRIQ